MSVEPIGLES